MFSRNAFGWYDKSDNRGVNRWNKKEKVTTVRKGKKEGVGWMDGLCCVDCVRACVRGEGN